MKHETYVLVRRGSAIKRAIDMVVAALMLTLCMPMLGMAALLIKLDSEGPILFRQMRMGRDFRPFSLLKLRTMKSGADGPIYTLGDDPRISRVGAWLRWLKIDEFPQFWNVLRGDMSLVGPRPVVPELVAEFAEDYARLLQVRPGLTDPATAKYCREAEMLAKAADPMDYFKSVVTPDKLRLSAEYLERATLWSDLGVLARTALALLARNSVRSALLITTEQSVAE